MKRFVGSILFALVISVGVPGVALAANLPILNPDFEIVPDPSDHDSSCLRGAPLSYGAVLQLVQNLMNASISVGAIILILIITYAGALFLFSPTSPEYREQGRAMLSSAVIGFVIVLASWLVVDFIMKSLYNPEVTTGTAKFGPWNEILGDGYGGNWCVKPIETTSIYQGEDLGEGSDLSSSAGSGVSSGGGTCTNPENQNNACSVTNMKKACFGDRANEASQVCMVESAGGQASAKSGSDKLDGGSGPSYSVGLWQINLTVHKVAGLNCPAAFTAQCSTKAGTLKGKIGNCTASIKATAEARTLYDKCVAAALNPENSTEVACRLYNQSGANGGFQPWQTTAKKCSVPLH
ncbi:hypothetical protein KKH15_00625 [Patescibacteria group bacterium]|nr:hypothetical protein [Patescibacteria group bacterium]MBU1755174.1 hypothetical protein [Patescibacteria group bacterium]